jgi:hypothetical protein
MSTCALFSDAEVVEKPAKEETVVENATPDYAAGLGSTQVWLLHGTALPYQLHHLLPAVMQPKCVFPLVPLVSH